MISYYPGDLPPITGNPDDIFLCDPIKEAASELIWKNPNFANT